MVALQQLLQSLGYYPTYTRIDGNYGMTTYRAVQEFQRAQGIHATGYVGARTRTMLLGYGNGNQYGAISPTHYGCIPSDIRTTDVVSSSGSNGTTVAQVLQSMHARCRGGHLIDSTGRSIQFYHLTGCWGNPPYDYQEILANQEQEIAVLRQNNTVVTMTCNPSGVMPF